MQDAAPEEEDAAPEEEDAPPVAPKKKASKKALKKGSHSHGLQLSFTTPWFVVA